MANDTTINVKKAGDGRAYLNIDTDKTLDETDNGVVQNIVKTCTITLPATVVGYDYTIRNAGAPKTSSTKGSNDNGSVTITVAPDTNDLIRGNAFTAVNNKAAVNTLGNIGDEIRIFGDGTVSGGWNFVHVKGTWTRAA